MEAANVYIPMDRRQALASGTTIPERTQGAALFADISGFTPLTEALALELGAKRGADELTHHLNAVYNALICELHRYGGSVISFSGDAITCWLDGDDGSRATACALGMQRAMQAFAAVTTHSGTTVSMGLKAAVATGPVRRFLVGDPAHCIIDVIAGSTLEHLAAAEQVAEKGEVILDPAALASLGDKAVISEWRETEDAGERLAVVAGLSLEVPERPWPPLPAGSLSRERTCAWLLSPVYQRLQSGQGEFLAELRPAVALFLAFGGIDYDEDPEAADKLDVFVRQVEGVLTRYEGSLLALTIGDKGSYLYAAFGAPIAHEDDATRAASAAVELQALAGGLDFIGEVRIGIARGRMRTGAYGSATRRTYSVLGDGVNLSARLMSAAEPGQILVSDGVRAVAESGFTWQDLPPIVVKGKREPVGIAWLRGVRQRRGLHLLEPRYSLPMVGRNAELALIEQKLERSAQGHGQIVGITAEAGMGKSRLAAEVIALAHRRGVVVYGDECQSYGTTTSYLVWRCIWRGVFDLDPQDPPQEQVQALELRLQQMDPRLLPRLPLLGAVLNLSIPDNDLTRSLDAKVRKSSLEALLVDCLRARAKERPLVLLLEDCHWLDPLSSDLIETIGRTLVDLPVLMVLVYRPWQPHSGSVPRVSQLPYFTEVRLAELDPQEAERLIASKLEQWVGCEAQAAPGFVDRITHQAAGNPFYIEELLNYLQDRGIRPGDESLAALDLPSTLYSLILSRMDQLAESQQTLMKVASVIGRSFRAAMVWGVYPQLGSIELVQGELQALNQQDLVLLDTPEPELSYLFKHVITQEVAYESLPYSTRAMLHEQIGRYIEVTYHATLEQYVNLLAFHYQHSENTAKKREYLLKAAEAAQGDYANAAAIEYYETLLPLLPAEEQVPVLLQLGKVLELTGQWQAAGERYEQALVLAEELGASTWQAWCEAAMAELLRKQGQYSAATAWLERARDRFQALNDEAGVGQVLHIWGSLAAQQTDLDTARARYGDSLAVRRKLRDQSNTAALLSNLGIVARIRGDHEEAQALHQQALTLRQKLGDKWAIANSLINLGNVHLDRGDYGAARSQLEEAVGLLREIGDRQAIANALHSLGSVTRGQGDYSASRDRYRESLTILWELRDTWLLAHLLEDIGGLAATQGQPERALQLAAAAATLRVTIGAPLSTAYQDKLDRMLKPSRQMLGEAVAEKSMAQGRTKTLEQAIEYAFETLVGSD